MPAGEVIELGHAIEAEAFVHHHYSNSWLLPLESFVVRYCTTRELTTAAIVLVAAAAVALIASVGSS